MRHFLNAYKRQIAFYAIIFITASLSFGLGYLADRQFNHTPIIIEQCATP
jgi:hypothetical protein